MNNEAQAQVILTVRVAVPADEPTDFILDLAERAVTDALAVAKVRATVHRTNGPLAIAYPVYPRSPYFIPEAPKAEASAEVDDETVPPEAPGTYSCYECGGSMEIDDSGVSNHVDDNGNIDYDKDADHVAVRDLTEAPKAD